MKKLRQFQGDSLRHILLGTVFVLKSRVKVVAVAILSFALLMATVSTFVHEKIQDIEDDIALRATISADVLQEKVTTWATETSDIDLLKFAVDYSRQGSIFNALPTVDNAPMLYVLRTGPYIFGALFFNTLILFIAFVFFLSSFSDPLLSTSEVVKRLPGTVVQMITLWFWMMIRSFSWIPIAGPILALYFFPRFTLAPSLLASGDCGIRESVRISLKQTSGQWLVVLGRLFVLFFVSIAILWSVIVIASVVTLFLVKLGFLAWLMGMVFVVAFQAAYLVVLTAILA